VGKLAGVGDLPIEIVAVEASVQVSPTALTDLPGSRPPESRPNSPALEALLQVFPPLLFSFDPAASAAWHYLPPAFSATGKRPARANSSSPAAPFVIGRTALRADGDFSSLRIEDGDLPDREGFRSNTKYPISPLPAHSSREEINQRPIGGFEDPRGDLLGFAVPIPIGPFPIGPSTLGSTALRRWNIYPELPQLSKGKEEKFRNRATPSVSGRGSNGSPWSSPVRPLCPNPCTFPIRSRRWFQDIRARAGAR